MATGKRPKSFFGQSHHQNTMWYNCGVGGRTSSTNLTVLPQITDDVLLSMHIDIGGKEDGLSLPVVV